MFSCFLHKDLLAESGWFKNLWTLLCGLGIGEIANRFGFLRYNLGRLLHNPIPDYPITCFMPSITDKLKSLGVQLGTRGVEPKPKLPSNSPSAIEAMVPGEVWKTLHGEAFVVQERYPADFVQGATALRWDASLEMVAAYARAPAVVGMPPEQFAFLDTETSGLAGGTGTYAFMVGAGRFEGDTFRLVQFFLRDPAEELSMLTALEEFLAPCKALVTFNGKSFDVPLLNTRYIQQGQASPLTEAAHVDLLHLARRLWRDRLPSRTLGDLEVAILGAYRTGEDVPGFLIPKLYFDYLRTGNAEPLKSVFYHNAMDILSLAALLNHMAGLLAAPMQTEHNLDLFAIGKLHDDLGHAEEAISVYRACLARETGGKMRREGEMHREAVLRLSMLHKRRGEMDAAMDLWREAAERGEVYAHVELAKVYEHKRRDPTEALKWTRAALTVINARGYPLLKRFEWQEALEHRLKRLKKKVEK